MQRCLQRIAGVGDLNGDSFADIDIQNRNTGLIEFASMAQGQFSAWTRVATAAGWSVAGSNSL